MTQDEKWMIHYNEVKTFIETYHWNPSKYIDSKSGLRNWVMQQELMNAGALALPDLRGCGSRRSICPLYAQVLPFARRVSE